MHGPTTLYSTCFVPHRKQYTYWLSSTVYSTWQCPATTRPTTFNVCKI